MKNQNSPLPTTDTGGSAYPVSFAAPNEFLHQGMEQEYPIAFGMSWLDSCAMKAMQAIAVPQTFMALAKEGCPKDKALHDIAVASYEIATAMLAEKRRREGGQA